MDSERRGKYDFFLFEKEQKLFDRRYLGIPYWQMLRGDVMYKATGDKFSEVQNRLDQQRGLTEKIKCIIDAFLFAGCSKYHFRNIKECDLLIIYNSTQKETDRFLDYWYFERHAKIEKLTGCFDPCKLSRVDKNNLMGVFLQENIVFLLGKLLRLQKRDHREYEFLKKLERQVRSSFGDCISAEQMERSILKYILMRKYSRKYFERLFNRTKCKAVVVNYYAQPVLYGAYEIAKKRGIRLVEFQHGVISGHRSYYFEDKRGINNHTPDYFLIFGTAQLEGTKLLSSTKAVPTGFYYQELMLRKYEKVRTEADLVIVYPSPEKEFQETVDRFINEAVKKGYKIIVKIHPKIAAKYKEYYPILAANTHVRVVTDQKKGVYYWLKKGKHHVMAQTTVAFEALVYEHTNICIAENVPHDMVQNVLDWGAASGFKTAEELMKAVEEPDVFGTDRKKLKELVYQSGSDRLQEQFFHDLIREELES